MISNVYIDFNIICYNNINIIVLLIIMLHHIV